MTDLFLLHRLQNHQFFLGVSGSRAVWEPMTDWQVNWLSMTGELTDRLVLKMLPHLKISWNLTIWPLRVRLVTEWSNAKQGWETEGSVAKNTSCVKPRFTYHRLHRWHICDTVVDHPTQLICIWIFICWVGSGDPCGAAELCISGPCNQKKQARTHVFSKYPCHLHKDCLEGKKRDKKRS